MTKQTRIFLATLMLTMASSATGQVKLTVDTLQCHIVGFSAGLQLPLGGSNSEGLVGGNMKDLYHGPYLDFGVEWDYLFQSGWLLSLDGDIWFGASNDNLQQREIRMGDVYNAQGLAMTWGGIDGVVTAYNRSLAVRPGIGKIFHVLPKNPNSGVLVKLSGGWWMQKTVFTQDMNEGQVYQLDEAYQHLYDHYRNGVMLTESLGFAYMNNHNTYINLKVSIDFSQCWSWSSRPHTLDNLMHLNGRDDSRYFDLMLGIKLSWLFPITGRTSYDYYYY